VPRREPYYGKARHRPRRAGLPPASFRLADAGLEELAAAAHANVVDGTMDGALALSYVVWPDGVPPNVHELVELAVDMAQARRISLEAARERLGERLGYEP